MHTILSCRLFLIKNTMFPQKTELIEKRKKSNLYVHFPYRSPLTLKSQLSGRIGNLKTKSLSLLKNSDALAGRNVVGNLGGVGERVHEQDLDIGDVANEEGLVA